MDVGALSARVAGVADADAGRGTLADREHAAARGTRADERRRNDRGPGRALRRPPLRSQHCAGCRCLLARREVPVRAAPDGVSCGALARATEVTTARLLEPPCERRREVPP